MNTFHLTYTDYEDDISYAIYQGCTFELDIFLEDNYSGWTARGQIRDRYRQDGGVLLAEMTFVHPLVFAPETIDGVTKSYTRLSTLIPASVTDALLWNLKIRSSADVDAVPGKNVWVYDIQLVSANGVTVHPVLRGFVEVLKESTQPLN